MYDFFVELIATLLAIATILGLLLAVRDVYYWFRGVTPGSGRAGHDPGTQSPEGVSHTDMGNDAGSGVTDSAIAALPLERN
jgi:hypothetical protein